ALRSPHAAVAPAPGADSPPEPPDGDSMSAAGVAGAEVAEGPAVADLESLRSLWPAVVDLVRAQNALLGALIEEAEPVAVQGEELTVAFAASAPFLKKKAEDPLNRAPVTEALVSLTRAGRWRLHYELRGDRELRRPSAPEPGSEAEWGRRGRRGVAAERRPGEPGAG